MRKQNRRGFTLIQLLVVLAIFAILLGLLLPAIQKVREAASRAQSQNNLKQIAIAMHAYHDVNASFPPGNDANNFSAATRLLPYIEQNNLFQMIDLQKPLAEDGNARARNLVIKTFLAPNDPVQQGPDGYGPTNYLFNAGSKPDLTASDGICFQDSKIKVADISDGTSNTAMAGETLKGDGGKLAMDVRRQHVLLGKDALNGIKDEAGVEDWKDNKHIVGDRCSSWMDGRFLQGTFTGTRPLNDPRSDVSCDGQGGLSALRGLYSGGILNVAMCDGSVRAISSSIDFKTWKLITSRNDGQVLPEF